MGLIRQKPMLPTNRSTAMTRFTNTPLIIHSNQTTREMGGVRTLSMIPKTKVRSLLKAEPRTDE